MSAPRRGRSRRVSREQFVEAGCRVARRVSEGRRSLAEILGVKQHEVLVEAGRILVEQGADPGSPVPTAPLLYRQWPTYSDYLASVFAALFSPGRLSPSALRDESAPDWKHNLDGHLRLDMEQAKDGSALYFGAFAGIADPVVREALKGVYEAYDGQVVPALGELLDRSGRTLEVEEACSAEALECLVVLLTAATEGLELRRLADPSAVEGREQQFRAMLVAMVQTLTQA